MNPSPLSLIRAKFGVSRTMPDLSEAADAPATPVPAKPVSLPDTPDDAPALLAALQDRSITFRIEGSKLFVEPREELTPADCDAIRQHKSELIDIIQCVAASKELFPVNPADLTTESMARSWAKQQRIEAEYAANLSRPWDDRAADAEVKAALEAVEKTEAFTWLSAAQRNLLGIFRRQSQDYRRKRNPQLFGMSVWVKGHVERWRRRYEAETRNNTKRPT